MLTELLQKCLLNAVVKELQKNNTKNIEQKQPKTKHAVDKYYKNNNIYFFLHIFTFTTQ
jgi:hypothetical protein